MSTTRLFQNSTSAVVNFFNNQSSTGVDVSSSTGIDDYDYIPHSQIDYSSKKFVAIAGSIAASMVLVFLVLFIKNRKNRNITQETFNCIIKKNSAHSVGDQLIIPKLGISYQLTIEEQNQIEEIGIRAFCKEQIKKSIAKRIEEDEPVQTNYLSAQVINVFLNKKDPTADFEKFDAMEDVLFEYNPRNKHCNFFNAVLQPFTQATMLFEMLFNLAQMISYMQLQDPILPISRDTNNMIIIVQVVLDLIMMLFITFTGAGQAFMTDLATSIDNFFVNKLCRRNKAVIPVIEESISQCTRAKIITANVLLGVFVFNSFYSQFIFDYQQAMTMKDKALGMDDSIIPAEAVYLCSMMSFGLNQLNDPVMILSQVFMGRNLINMYFRNNDKSTPKPAVKIEEVNEEKAEVKSAASPVESSGYRRLGSFSQRTVPRLIFSKDDLAIRSENKDDLEAGLISSPIRHSL